VRDLLALHVRYPYLLHVRYLLALEHCTNIKMHQVPTQSTNTQHEHKPRTPSTNLEVLHELTLRRRPDPLAEAVDDHLSYSRL
jgi:hypothetical protein